MDALDWIELAAKPLCFVLLLVCRQVVLWLGGEDAAEDMD